MTNIFATLTRGTIAAGLLLGCVTAGMLQQASVTAGMAQQADPATQADYPLTGDEGQRVLNHTVRLLGPIDRLPGVVTVGNPKGKATLVEFYDLNCPYCRQAASDIGAMIEQNHDLKVVLAPYPVLGIGSITAGRVELGVAKLGTPQQFYAFHRRIFAQRGATDGLRALEIARGLGFDPRSLTTLADSDQITRTMKNLVSLGNSLGLVATPSFVVGNVAIVGYPGPHALQAIVEAAATCGKVAC
jgi:2-hydroxychromene-2-carboxylate isomerase